MLTVLAALALQPPPANPQGITVSQQAPDPAADRGVRIATDIFLSSKGGARLDVAYALLTPAQQAQRPREAWIQAARDFNSRAGALRSRRIVAVSWINDPARPYPYAAVEYDGDYANLVFMCGVLIWERQPEGGWRVFRESISAATRADAPNATPEQIAEGRRQNNCRD